MHICMLMTNFWPLLGGGQQQLRILSVNLIHKGVKVSVLMRRSKNNKRYEKIDGIDIYAMPTFLNNIRVVSSFCYILFSFIWLLRNRKNYDIIHCHQAYSPATAGILAKIFLKKQVVVKITASNEYGEMREIKKLPFFKTRKRLLKKVDRFIIISPQVKNELAEIGIQEKQMAYIPNGVEIKNGSAFDENTKIFFRNKLSLPYEKIAIFSGRFSQEKSLDTLLLAWRKINDKFINAHLLLLGDGGRFRNVEDDLKNLAKELGLSETVHFPGRSDNVYDYLLASDIFILPSLSEGMSNALLEAMMAGLAILASNIDGNRNIIQDRINGLLFKCRNYEQLAEFIGMLLKQDGLRERLGKEARASAIGKYSIGVVADKHLQLYKQLLS